MLSNLDLTSPLHSPKNLLVSGLGHGEPENMVTSINQGSSLSNQSMMKAAFLAMDLQPYTPKTKTLIIISTNRGRLFGKEI